MAKVLSFPYGDSLISFYPVYSPHRQTVEIAVEAPGKVIVTAPEGRTDDELIQVVTKKAYWITQQLYQLKSVRFQPVIREMVNGESLLYLGRNYRLELELFPSLKKADVRLDHGVFKIQAPSMEPDYLRSHLIEWYRFKAREKVEARIRYYAPKLGVTPTDIHIKDQKKRWGSCTKDGVLYFNWRCVLAPSPVLDYVVVHELCHLLEKQHSSRFWALLRTAMPEYETRKAWLLSNGVRLDL